MLYILYGVLVLAGESVDVMRKQYQNMLIKLQLFIAQPVNSPTAWGFTNSSRIVCASKNCPIWAWTFGQRYHNTWENFGQTPNL